MDSNGTRVGFYGGTFNPVHVGHLLVAREARERLGLDTLYVLPNSRSPLRVGEALAPAESRLEMLRLALEGEEGLGVCDLEVRRGGTSYTVETLRELRRRHAGVELTFLMGADSLETFDRWVGPEEICDLARVVVLPRPGVDAHPALEALEKRASGVAGKIRVLPEGRRIDISATEVRRRAAAGQSIRWLVPEAVERYLLAHRLYRM